MNNDKNQTPTEKRLAQQFLEIAAKAGDDLAAIELAQNKLAHLKPDSRQANLQEDKTDNYPNEYVEIYQLVRRAAYHGYAKAQILLATLYQNGLGVQKDLLQAGAWYGIAKHNGFSSINLEEMLAKLSNDQQQEIINRQKTLLLPL